MRKKTTLAQPERMFSREAFESGNDDIFVTKEQKAVERAEEKELTTTGRKITTRGRIKTAQRDLGKEIADEALLGYKKAQELGITEDEYLRKREARTNVERLVAEIKDKRKEMINLVNSLMKLNEKMGEEKKALGWKNWIFKSDKIKELEEDMIEKQVRIDTVDEELKAMQVLLDEDSKIIQNYEQMVQDAKAAKKKVA